MVDNKLMEFIHVEGGGVCIRWQLFRVVFTVLGAVQS